MVAIIAMPKNDKLLDEVLLLEFDQAIGLPGCDDID